MDSTNGSVPDTDDTLTNVKRMASKAVILGNRAKTQNEDDEAQEGHGSAQEGGAVSFDDLVATIDALDVSKRVRAIMDMAKDIAALPPVQRIEFFAKLNDWGIKYNVQRDLRGHISKIAKSAECVSAEIRKDLRKWGYDLWLNDLDDSVYNGNERVDDPMLSTLRMRARDAGYAESRMLSALDDAVVAFAAENRRHPLKVYLEGLKWDGKDHIKKLASYFAETGDQIVYSDGTKRSQFEAALRRWLVGSIGKIHADGDAARSNFVLTLASGQDLGKSHFAKWMCPLPEYHVEKHVNPDDKDFSLTRARTWIWEIGEMDSTTGRADASALKNFITQTVVQERKAYGHFDTVKPSIVSYIGTVNPDGACFMVDPTGNRRFIIVGVSSIDWAYSSNVDIGQLWAQAMHMWRADKTSYRFSKEEKAVFADNAADNMVSDIIGDMIARVYEIDPSHQEWKASSSEILDKLRTFAGLSRTGDSAQGRAIARSLFMAGISKEKKRSNGSTIYRGLRLREEFASDRWLK